MKAGDTFEQNGATYIVQVAGTEFRAKNTTNCILPHGKSSCIKINSAVKKGLISLESECSGKLFDTSGKSMVREGSSRRAVKPRPSEPSPQNVDGTFYMPVDQLRAQVFLAHGLIYPAVYDAAGLASDFDDSQSATPGELTLFSVPQAVPREQLQLRLLLLPAEVEDSQSFRGGIRLSVPLPISRIVEIQVSEHVTDLAKYLAGWVKPDVPIPSHLFGSVEKNEVAPRLAPTSKAKASMIPEVENAIRTFDQRMGGLAFLRNTSRYLSDATGKYADYPPSFFALAEALMGQSLSREQATEPPLLSLPVFGLAEPECPGDAALYALTTSGSAYIDKDSARNCAKELFTATGENDELAQAFTALFKKNDYRTAIRELQGANMPPAAAILAALYKFSNRKGDDRRSVKQRLHDDWTSSARMEGALCALGNYYGYTALDAKETRLYSVHPLIRPLIEDSPAIKFDLTTRFERRLIEAVYQLSFFDGSERYEALELYDSHFIKTEADIPRYRSAFVKDESYFVQDLPVRHYTVTTLGRIIDRLRSWARGFIDESSETGKYLMSSCFFYAESYELSKERSTQTLRYRISTEKLIELLSEDRISINANVLEAALAEDTGAR